MGKEETPRDEWRAGLLKEDNKGTTISCSAIGEKGAEARTFEEV
jgi:hypothetical protein